MAGKMSTVRCLSETHGENFTAYHGDCVDIVRQLPDASIGFSVFSPPFASLYVYSDSVADMGNSASREEFSEQYGMLAAELIRVVKPGRLVAVHCSDLPYQKWRDGFIGLDPFSDDLTAIHRARGWILHSRITIWKDPVVEMQRTKALGLLHKQLLKDSCMSRVGMSDYVLVFRAPGENREPVSHSRESFPVERWQQWASPVWSDVSQTNVLNGREAREAQDEKHICPLQLDLILRAITLWSNPGDTVLSPFMGIGSEGVVALRNGRRFVGVELKETYYKQAVGYLQGIDKQRRLA
jgi:DNA modification methylase